HVLAVDVVRFVGEPVAAVVADTHEQASAAAQAIWVDCEERPAVVDPVQATRGGPAVVDAAPDNISAVQRHGDAQATDAAFARAAHVVAVEIVTQRLAPTPIEPRCVAAWMDDGRLTVRLSSQMPTGVGATRGAAPAPAETSHSP